MDAAAMRNGGSCANASNPYHKCTQACTKQPHTSVELAKKVVVINGRGLACPKSSNPYHTCHANCNKLTSSNNSSGAKNDHRKKKLVGSKPQPPVATNNPSSTKSHYSDPKIDEIVPSSGQLHIPAVKPKDQVKDGVTTEVVHDETGSKDFSFSGKKEILDTNNTSSEEGEAEADDSVSVVSESRISIGKYNVKESFGSILQTILDKYGDIGASCDLESVVMRSYYMECVCFVVQELQSNSLSKSKVSELLDIVKDVESAHLGVAWLRDEIAEMISHHQDMETEKANYDTEIESLREELELELELLAQKEQEVADINNRIPEIRDRLRKLEQLMSSDQTTLPIKSKIKIDQLL